MEGFRESGSEYGPSIIREYRSDDDLIGCVKRTRRNPLSGECGDTRVRFFVWANPSSEYATEPEARSAIEGVM